MSSEVESAEGAVPSWDKSGSFSKPVQRDVSHGEGIGMANGKE